MLKGNVIIDTLIGIFVISCCVGIISLCVTSYFKVESNRVFLNKWQVEEYDCEVWCDSFWFYDD